MANDPLVALPAPPDPPGDGDWGEVVNAAFRTLETRINVLRQYVLDNPGGGGGTPDDEDLAALIADANSATNDVIVALIVSNGASPVITVDSITDAGAVGKAGLLAATQDAALTAFGAQSALWRPAVADVTGLSTALAGRAPLSHTHIAANVTGLSTVATTGSYNDLANRPVIPGAGITTAAAGQVFFRQYISGAWEARGSSRADVLVFWLANGSGATLPGDAVDPLDLLVS